MAKNYGDGGYWQAREEMAELMTIDPRKGGIVVAELRYLQRQLAELPLLDKLEGPPSDSGCGCHSVIAPVP